MASATALAQNVYLECRVVSGLPPLDGGVQVSSDAGMPVVVVSDAGVDAGPKDAAVAVDAAAPVDPSKYSYTACAAEFSQCAFTGSHYVRFGVPGAYTYTLKTGGVLCSFQVLGDPAPGKTKSCAVSGSPTTVIPADAGTPVVVPPITGSVDRPAASKGVGLYVKGSVLFDGNGKEFRIRGANATHEDVPELATKDLPYNATRFIAYFNSDPNRVVKDMSDPAIGWSSAYKRVQIPGDWGATCSNDLNKFNAAVALWVKNAKLYQAVEENMILNIANEALDANQWLAAYTSAVQQIRAAGWNGAFMIDASGCGQDPTELINGDAAKVLAADPQHNIIFSLHVYGAFADTLGGVPKSYSQQNEIGPTMDAMKATGLAFVIGEFGPRCADSCGGFSPPAPDPMRVVALAEAHGFGWMPWAWSNNSMADSKSNGNDMDFLWTNNVYTTDADLTPWGLLVKQAWQQYGAKPATTF